MRTFEDLVDEAAAVDVSGWRLDAHTREHGAFVAHSTRTLVEARRA